MRAQPLRPARLLLAVVGALIWYGSGLPASASCSIDNPSRSPVAFVGVVVGTTSKGRVATVRTDSGATVEVIGTPGLRRDESAGTSVDRSYEVGGRYEFHPVNTSSPFEDNYCTATRLLSRVAVPELTSSPVGPGEAGTTSPGAWRTGARTAVLIAAGVAALAALLWRGSRHRRST